VAAPAAGHLRRRRVRRHRRASLCWLLQMVNSMGRGMGSGKEGDGVTGAR
jgi:hypothetical protein